MTIAKLATGRALIAAAVTACIAAVKHFGAPVPDGAAEAVNMALDALIVLTAFVFTGEAHHAEKPNAQK